MDLKDIPKLTILTFPAWQKAMSLALMAEGCMDIVNGEEEEPEPPEPLTGEVTDEDIKEYKNMEALYRAEYKDYNKREGKAAWMIARTLGEGVDAFIKDTNDPFVMWGNLAAAMDTKGNLVHQRALRKRFSDLVHDGKETIDQYIAKLKEFQRALNGTPDPISDEALVSKIFTTLPKEWDLKIRAIEDNDSLDLPQIEKILRNYQLFLSSTKVENIALAAKGKKPGKGRGKKAKTKAADKKVTSGRVNKEAECWYCLQKGHFKNDCPTRKEVIRRSKERKEGKDKGEAANVAEKSGDVCSEEEEKACMAKRYHYDNLSDWVLDSGATSHMCHDRTVFEDLRKLPKPKKISLADDYKVEAYGIGTIHLTDELVLQGVLYVPDLSSKLCSVKRLSRAGYSLLFQGDDCIIADKGYEIARARGEDLYFLKEKVLLVREPKKEEAKLWHRRLGHLHMAGVKALQEMAEGMAVVKGEEDAHLCGSCVQGKHQKVYNRHEPAARMTRRLEMIHSDTCGPFRTASQAGARSFVLFTDDLTRMVWCFFLKSKTETMQAFKDFKAITEKHSGEVIRRFRCDNGRAEYDNAEFRGFLKEHGISYEPSAPHTQNQNGVSERMNRTIIEKARTMLLEACLSESFWAEAVNTAVYLHNRSPTRSLEGKTPFEAWNGVRPDLSHLKVFGCDAYLHVPDEARTKLESKSRNCIFLGYVRNTTKLWRLWDIAGRRVVRGANVRFDEQGRGGRGSAGEPQQGKPAPEIIDPFQSVSDLEGSGSTAIDDGSRGRFATGTPLGPGVIDGAPIAGSGKVMSKGFTSGNGHAMDRGQDPGSPEVTDNEQDSSHEKPGEETRKSGRVRTKTKLFPGMRAFVARIGKDGEPVTFQDALDEHPTRWQKAIAEEYASHEENGTWRPATLPAGRKALSTKWVFKNKTNADGSIRHKARLVVRGFEQKQGIDFQETFAPVAKFPTVRIMLALATHFDWEIHQMDVKTAFLYPVIEDEVYISIPEGYQEFHPDKKFTEEVFRLQKTLYGLRQSPLAWYRVVDSFLCSKGLIRSNEDSSLYISESLIVILFVDDILLFAKDMATIQEAKGWLTSQYRMTDLGELRQFLGMQIMRNRKDREMFLGQQRYFRRILEQCKMADCKGCKTPMDPKIFLIKPADKDITGVTEYKSLIGSLMYGMLGTRPDLGYAISTLSKVNDCPGEEHHAAGKRALRYLQESKDYGIRFMAGEPGVFPEPVCYTDSDWAGDKENRRSTGGYVFMLAGGAVSWKTKRQSVVAMSSTEAEYIALSEATKEAVWMRRLLVEIESRVVKRPVLDAAAYHEEELVRQWEPEHEEIQDPAREPEQILVSMRPQVILADNQGSIKMTENVLGNTRAKHIDLRYHYVRDAWQDSKICLQYEPTETMTADILTKPLARDRHWSLLRAMGLAPGISDGIGKETQAKHVVLQVRQAL